MSAPEAEIAFHAGPGASRAVDRAALAAALVGLVRHFPRPIARIDVLLVGDAEMDRLHLRHSGIAGTTDVLSFPGHDTEDPAAPVEADLVVSTDVATREAAPRGHPVEREILLYAVHGTLHACGYRDDAPEAAAAIHAEEDRILAAGGVGATYARPAGGPSRADGRHEDPRA